MEKTNCMLNVNKINSLVRGHVELFLEDVTSDMFKEEEKAFKNGFKAGFNFAKCLTTDIKIDIE